MNAISQRLLALAAIAARMPPPILAPETPRWSYFDGTLRFGEIDVADPGSIAIFERPWCTVV